MYKQIKGFDNNVTNDAIMRIADVAYIPNDPQNRDWQEYQAWLALGNTPEAAE